MKIIFNCYAKKNKNKNIKIFIYKIIKIYLIYCIFFLYKTFYAAENINTTILLDKKKYNIQDIIKYEANIIKYDVAQKRSYLIGNASINYTDLFIKANYIEINWQTNTLYAFSKESSYIYQDNISLKKILIIYKNKKYYCNNFFFNLKTQVGIGNNLFYEAKQGVIVAKSIKKRQENILFMNESFYTHDPYFKNQKDYLSDYFLKTKFIKYVNNKFFITGPILMYLYQIPTPILLPFFFLSTDKNKKFQILLPHIGRKNHDKFFIKNLGCFFPILNNWVIQIAGSIYHTSSWKIDITTKYKFNNQYLGNIESLGKIKFIYQQFFYQELKSYNKNIYEIKWQHKIKNINQKLTLFANLNYSDYLNHKNSDYLIHKNSDYLNHKNSDYLNHNNSDYLNHNNSDYLNHKNSDYLNHNNSDYLNHKNSDYLIHKNSDYLIPNVYNLSSINIKKHFHMFPLTLIINNSLNHDFDKKTITMYLPNIRLLINQMSPLKNINNMFLKNLTFNYNININNIFFYDDQHFLRKKMFKMMNTHFEQQLFINTKFNLFQYFRIIPNIIYNEKKIFFIKTNYDNLLKNIANTLLEFKFGINLFFSLYGIKHFSNNTILKALRHKIDTQIIYSYSPRFIKNYNYNYNNLEDQIIDRSKNIKFLFSNNVKVKVKNNNTYKTINLIDHFNILTTYDISKKLWHDLVFYGNTTIKNFLFDISGRLYINDNFKFLDKTFQLFTIKDCWIAIGYKLNNYIYKSYNKRYKKKGKIRYENFLYDDYNYAHYNILWNLNCNINYHYSNLLNNNLIDKKLLLILNGNIAITPFSKIGINIDYDIINKKIINTLFIFDRDLRSFKIKFIWNTNNIYYFYLGINN